MNNREYVQVDLTELNDIEETSVAVGVGALCGGLCGGAACGGFCYGVACGAAC